MDLDRSDAGPVPLCLPVHRQRKKASSKGQVDIPRIWQKAKNYIAWNFVQNISWQYTVYIEAVQ